MQRSLARSFFIHFSASLPVFVPTAGRAVGTVRLSYNPAYNLRTHRDAAMLAHGMPIKMRTGATRMVSVVISGRRSKTRTERGGRRCHQHVVTPVATPRPMRELVGLSAENQVLTLKGMFHL